MAGKTIYTGDMIASLESKIDAMVTTLQAHTTALGNINTAVANSVSELNVKVGTGKVLVINTIDKAVTQPSANTWSSFGITMSSRSNGVVRFAGRIKSNATGQVDLGIEKNGGAMVISWSLPTFTVGTYYSFSFDYAVKAGDALIIKAKSTNNSPTFTIEAGATLSYDILDIVNAGGFAIA